MSENRVEQLSVQHLGHTVRLLAYQRVQGLPTAHIAIAEVTPSVAGGYDDYILAIGDSETDAWEEAVARAKVYITSLRGKARSAGAQS